MTLYEIVVHCPTAPAAPRGPIAVQSLVPDFDCA